MDPLTRRKLRSPEAAAYLGLSASTLAKMRLRGDGPPYCKAGPRIVVYDVSDLDEWLARSRREPATPEAEGSDNGRAR